MAITDALLPEFDHEMGTTRRLLERVPEEAFGWKPHEKSWTLGELSGHLANLPTWCRTIVGDTQFDLATVPQGDPVRAQYTKAAMIASFDRNVAAARELIAGRTDGELMAGWTLKRAGQQLFTVPRIAAIRSFVVNHSIHHRGQLSVYLRMNNVAVPAIYGPSADEGF